MKRCGFTLVEIIVVISIIVLMISILTSALNLSKEKAREAVCASNIKQILTALMLYDSTNNSLPFGYLSRQAAPGPPKGGYPGNAYYDRPGWWWFNFIGDYYSESEYKNTILNCPSRKIYDFRFKTNMLYGNYGANQYFFKSSHDWSHKEQFKGRPWSTDNISNPSEALLIADSGYTLIHWWHVTENPPHKLTDFFEDVSFLPGLSINEQRTNIRQEQKEDAIEGRHSNKTINAGFADGHVARIQAEHFLVEKQQNDTYTNLSPAWLSH